MDLIAYFEAKYPDVMKQIEDEQVLTDELKEKILSVTKEFKSTL
jgi:F-type H+-transporting ATPase subunit alpha